MTALIHVLGADVPHHNQTLLRFFNEQLASDNEHARQFMLVGQPVLVAEFGQLTIRCFADQKSLAGALVACARANPAQRFLLHGQFNPWLWLALASGRLPGARVCWHIWGADLYETSRRLKHLLLYRLRRLAQHKIGRVFATRGDLHYFSQRFPGVPGDLLYFPTKMPVLTDKSDTAIKQGGQLTLLVGNSGDPTNQHITALQAIHRQFGDQVKLILPMGYPAGNQTYIDQVTQASRALFSAKNVQILQENLPFEAYLALLRHCDAGYFLFARQQGIGTQCLLIQANIPCVLSRENPFWRDMQEQQIPMLFCDEPLTDTMIRQMQRQLQMMDKCNIAFFSPGYLPLWQRALNIAVGRTHDTATI